MKTIDPALLPALSRTMEMELEAAESYEAVKNRIAAFINELILHDFGKLVALLYRIDISEAKLKYLLRENTDKDAAGIIAELIIEREIQKFNSRREHRVQDDISEDEKW
jgi:hypothetical protein